MRLRKLTVRTLPGIRPGFTFKPPGAGVNLVVGPNAVGKSSLIRALKYLLGSSKDEPPALSLEAEFEDGETRWQVTRNGSQIAWRRDGAAASRPALPSPDQIDLYRLSVERLLDADDASDKKLAGRMRRELLGDCDLDALRAAIARPTGRRFGWSESRELNDTSKAARQVESDYAALRLQEAALPDFDGRIGAAEAAGRQVRCLEQALKLLDAIEARTQREQALQHFPPEMARLAGDELERIAAREKKAAGLRVELHDRQRKRESASAVLESSGLAGGTPKPEELEAASQKLRALDKLAADRDNAREAVVQANAGAQYALAQLEGSGEPPHFDADASRRAETFAAVWIAATKRHVELQTQLKLAGETPDASEIERLRDGSQALRDWLAARKARAEQESAPRRRFPWAATGAVATAVLAAGWAGYLQATPVALVAALAALLAAAAAAEAWLATRRGSPRPTPTEDPENRFRGTGLELPPQWDEPAVRQHLREVEAKWEEQRVLQKRAEGAERIKADIKEAETELARQEAAKVALAGEIGIDPTLPMVAFERFIRLCTAWDQARTKHIAQADRLKEIDRDITETARSVRKFLDAWPAPEPAANGHSAAGADENAAAGTPDPDRLRSTFERLQQRVATAGNACSTIQERDKDIESIRRQINEEEEETRQVYVDAGLATANRSELAERLERLEDWKAAKRAVGEAATTEKLARAELKAQPGLIARAEAGERAQLVTERNAAEHRAAEHTGLIQERQAIRTRLEGAGKDRRLETAASAEGRARQALEDKREEALLAEATAVLLNEVEQEFEAEHEPDILRRAREIFAEVTARAFDLHLRGDGVFAARDVEQDAVRTLGELSSGTRMQLLLALRLAWTEAEDQGAATLPCFSTRRLRRATASASVSWRRASNASPVRMTAGSARSSTCPPAGTRLTCGAKRPAPSQPLSTWRRSVSAWPRRPQRTG